MNLKFNFLFYIEYITKCIPVYSENQSSYSINNENQVIYLIYNPYRKPRLNCKLKIKT